VERPEPRKTSVLFSQIIEKSVKSLFSGRVGSAGDRKRVNSAPLERRFEQTIVEGKHQFSFARGLAAFAREFAFLERSPPDDQKGYNCKIRRIIRKRREENTQKTTISRLKKRRGRSGV